MPGAEKELGRDEREAHRVLVAVPDPARLRGVRKKLEHPGVGGDVEDVLLRVVAEAVDVDRPGILRFERYSREPLRGSLLIGAATTGHNEQPGYNRNG